MTLLGAINTVDPANYGYVDAGVAVHVSALGAPASIYTSGSDNHEGFNSSIGVLGQSLLSTTQCSPVMTKNPITCTASGNATYFEFEGQVTIVFAGLQGASICLAEALGDSAWLDKYDASSAVPAPYGVTCTVDMAPALEYRELHLTLQQSTGSTGAYSRGLSATSSEVCTPVPSSPFAGSETQNLDKFIALASFAAYQPVVVPWADWARPLTLDKTTNGAIHTNYIRKGSYAFTNSKNALEDVLALTSALVMSRATLTGASGQIEYVGKSTVLYTRAGTGEIWALVFIAPSLLVLCVIVGLIIRTRRKSAGFSSEQLGDLVGLRFEH
ncbi:hypothetical protein DL98DRAFT_593478 [Cadophora sp. DSE1049]|nr:hypothetical protein DL98DRAFT_593478 [Cadophora sp. DSE1049]